MSEQILYDIFARMKNNKTPLHGRFIKDVRKADKAEDCGHKDVIVTFEDGFEEYFDAKHQD